MLDPSDPVSVLVSTLQEVRRDVHTLREDMERTRAAAQAAEAATVRHHGRHLDNVALGSNIASLDQRITALHAAFAARDVICPRAEFIVALNEIQSGLEETTQTVRRAASHLTIRFALGLGVVVLAAGGVLFGSSIASTIWGRAERARLSADIERLRLALPQLEARAQDWQQRAGRAALIPCHDRGQARLCARIDTGAPRFGRRGEWAVLDGY